MVRVAIVASPVNSSPLPDEFPRQVFGEGRNILRAQQRINVLDVRPILQAADRVH